MVPLMKPTLVTLHDDGYPRSHTTVDQLQWEQLRSHRFTFEAQRSTIIARSRE